MGFERIRDARSSEIVFDCSIPRTPAHSTGFLLLNRMKLHLRIIILYRSVVVFLSTDNGFLNMETINRRARSPHVGRKTQMTAKLYSYTYNTYLQTQVWEGMAARTRITLTTSRGSVVFVYIELIYALLGVRPMREVEVITFPGQDLVVGGVKACHRHKKTNVWVAKNIGSELPPPPPPKPSLRTIFNRKVPVQRMILLLLLYGRATCERQMTAEK
ncbi:hypothetical protein QTP88_017756 [Uroleucon formosanum]